MNRSQGRRRLPMFLQMEANECGLASLAMLAHHHGLGLTLAQLRQQLGISRKGTTLYGLVQMAQALGLELSPVSLDLDALPQLELPCLLHWDLEHFVVLDRITRRGVVIHDPAVGVRRVSMDEFARRFTGVAAMCRPGAGFRPRQPPAAPSLRRWLGPVPGLGRDLVTILAFTGLLELLGLSMPLLLQWVVDEALPGDQARLVDGLVVGFALLVLMSAALEAARGWMIALLGTRLNLQWMQRVLAHLLRLPLVYFERRHVGDVSTSFGSMAIIQNKLTHQFIETVVDGLLSVGTLAMLWWLSPPGAALAGLGLAAYVGLRWTLQASLRQATAEQIVHSARQQSHFLETVRGIQGVRLYGRAEQRLADWGRHARRELVSEQRLGALHVSHHALSRLLFGLQRVVMVWLAAHAVLAGEVTLGLMFAFLAYLEQFSQRAAGLVDSILELLLLRLHVDRVGDIVHTPVEAQDAAGPSPGAGSGSDGPLALSVRGLAYAYGFAEPRVLDGVDLAVGAGECVAITGPSGCGKTTLVKLMLGLHVPDEGEVFVNGEPLARYGRDRLRAEVGTVMQDDILFTGTLAENISFFDPHADPDWIECCARMAAVHDEIMAMPMGCGSLLGEAGVGLSGGQKQRLMLARALYRRPKLLVLDEATSHLDVRSEALVNDAVKTLAVTRIIVAHRPQTIAMADRVIELGAIRGDGPGAETDG